MGVMAAAYVIMFLMAIFVFPFFLVYGIYKVHKERKIDKYLSEGMYDHANQLRFGKDCPKHFEMKDK